MDTTKNLTADQVQEYLARGVALLPHIYEHLLNKLHEMEKKKTVCMLPIARFDLYHIHLKRKLSRRIAQHRIRHAKKRVA